MLASMPPQTTRSNPVLSIDFDSCRDWFQLTLKEGLTVFRDQVFSGDMGSHAIKRIEVRMPWPLPCSHGS